MTDWIEPQCQARDRIGNVEFACKGHPGPSGYCQRHTHLLRRTALRPPVLFPREMWADRRRR